MTKNFFREKSTHEQSSGGIGTPDIRIAGSRNAMEKWVEGKLDKAIFFIFCQIFTIFDDFSKLHSAFSALYYEESSKMKPKYLAKKEENPC